MVDEQSKAALAALSLIFTVPNLVQLLTVK